VQLTCQRDVRLPLDTTRLLPAHAAAQIVDRYGLPVGSGAAED
jgi:hypothetical protein